MSPSIARRTDVTRHALILLAVLGICSVATGAEECGWLATDKVNQAFPDLGPWQTIVGGKVGACKFVSNRTRPPNIFGANQMIQKSASEAEEYVRSLKTSLAESYDVQAAATLGKEGFHYTPRPGVGDPDKRSVFFVGHRQQVTVMGSLTFQNAITPAQRKAGEELLQAALAVGDDKEKLSAASNCSWFDPTLIRRLLPGDDFSEHVFGSNSCMANAGDKVVILSIVEGGAESLLRNALDSGCTSEPVPSLGKMASIQFGCTSGNPAASVRFASEDRVFTFSLAPGKEPTPDERALLIKLAEHASTQKR